jgi:hypothetical protein
MDKAAGAVFRAPIEPAQVAKRAARQMAHEKLIGAGKQYAPTLYTVLVSAKDDVNLFAFYPTMGAEIETYLMAKGTEDGLYFDGRPLVRFIVDPDLKSGKFDVVAEVVAAPIVAKLRQEELEYYGLAPKEPARAVAREVDDGPDEWSDERGYADDDYAGGDYAGGTDEPDDGGLRAGLARARAADAASGGARAARAGAGAAGVGIGAAGAAAAAAGVGARSPRVARAPRAAQATQAPEAASGNARLSDFSAGKTYALTQRNIILGRDNSCDIVINDANASRQHARISQDALGTWKLVDLDSTNGTTLNDRAVTQALLRDGDRITIGVTVLEFSA